MSQGSFDDNFAAPTDLFAAAADAETRSAFITKTYSYLAGAVLGMIALEVALFQILGMAQAVEIAKFMMGNNIHWLVVIGIFMVVQWVANSWALNSTSHSTQLAGLVLYAVVASIVLFPLLTMALLVGGTEIIASAGVATGGLFALMTLAVFLTRSDFSFLRTFLFFATLAALGYCVFSLLFGFNIGAAFIYIMIALSCGYILYDTSNVLHHYRVHQHVAASLALLASLFLLFWYVLLLFMRSRD